MDETTTFMIGLVLGGLAGYVASKLSAAPALQAETPVTYISPTPTYIFVPTSSYQRTYYHRRHHH